MDENNEFSIFCRNIYYLRVSNRLTQVQMAHKLGISIPSLRKLEHGILPPGLSCNVLFAIQHNFGISIHSLFTPLHHF